MHPTLPPMQTLSALALVVRDYDEAIAWYTRSLAFDLLEDTDLGGGKRWVRVAPRAPEGALVTALLLAKAVDPEQTSRIGNQAGGRVFLFLSTDDFDADYTAMTSRGVVFEEPPRSEPYGKVAVFRDLYGNRWDLVERAPRP
jgi:catechol 2,3-dioxygenase-like lactoylglutathione lyase family enzyme